MLALMKSLMNSFIGKIVIMIIIAGMAFWGVDQMFAQIRGGLGSDLAAAGSRALDRDAFDRKVENVLRNINLESEEPLTKGDALEQGLIDQIYQIEVSQLTLLGYARSIGVRPSAEAVIRELEGTDAFKNPLTGTLDLNTYLDVLRQNQISQLDYEQQISDELTLKAIHDGGSAAIYPSKTLANIQARYIGEEREVAWFLLDTSSLPDPGAPTEDEIRAYYDENIDSLEQPERRMIDMLKLSTDDFVSEVSVTDQEVATIYEASKSERFSEPDTRTYVELLFDTREAARTAFGLLATGADPASLDGVVSSQTRTGRRDSVTDPALAEAMFGRGKQSGALLEPTQRGDKWLVARLISVQPGPVFPLETVEQQIRDELSRERAEILLYEKLNDLDRALGAGYPLSQIAEEVGVPLITFAPVDANGLTENGTPMVGLMAAGEAFNQAFQIPVGETSNRYEGPDAVYLTSPRSVTAPYTPEYEEIRDRVRDRLMAQRAANAVQTVIEGITRRIQSGETTLEEEAAAVGEVVESPLQPITRMTAAQAGLPNTAISAVFSGDEGEVFTLPSRAGDLVMIMQIKSITPPDEAQMATLTPLATASLVSALENDLNAALDMEIAQEMKLRSNPAALNAYKASISIDQ